MKKTSLLLGLLLVVSLPLLAERVDSETARKVAANFLSNGTKATELTDLTDAVGLANLYIFNANNGFVVMSADDCAKPILGYSLTGRFVSENLPENILFWLQAYNDEIQIITDHQLSASAETAQQWNNLKEGIFLAEKATPVVGPLIQTTWDQDNPYNLYCPDNSMTGCVATAMAQIMNFWQYPIHGMGIHSYIPVSHPEYGTLTGNFNETYYDWANMADSYSSSSTTTQKQAVATLMHHCGISVEMDYDPSSSGAASSSVPSALSNYFGYSNDMQFIYKESYTDDQWKNLLKTELNANRPVYYSGRHSGGGHAFVCDGYDTDNYFHFNWGWSGYQDGYWAIGALNPGSGGSGSGSGTYNLENAIIIGLQPQSLSSVAEPSNLTFTLDDNDLTLSWDASTGAVSYNIYMNTSSVPIGNTSTTSFLAEDIQHGTHLYFVRSVDASGNLSLSSNGAFVTLSYSLPIVDDFTANISDNQANLSWTAPEWCFPETESASLSYGSGDTDGSAGFPAGSYNLYWGHQYRPEDLLGTADKMVYKISFYVRKCGTYQLLLYQGLTSDELPATTVFNKTFIAMDLGWFDIELDTPIAIDATQDFWVFLYDPEAKEAPIAYCDFSSHDRGCYYSFDPYNPTTGLATMSGAAFLIKTYLTDGVYTYNLYQDGVKIAEDLPGTTYNATLNNNAANLFCVKTNYYGGETDDSNKAGFAKGIASTSTLEMGDNDRMTITENSKLTVTGAISNDNSANFIIENGAQLIHNSTGVKATVKKNITPYITDDDGWNFIASPVIEDITPNAENGLLNGTYDLYYYDEPTFYWMNHKFATFDLVHQQGYLYANNAATTLKFEGTLAPSNNPISITGLSRSATELNGFNLVGNPFVCDATIDQDCYVIDGRNVVLAPNSQTFAPGEGTFVKATSDSYTLTFTKATGAKDSGATNCLDLVIKQDKSTVDRVRIRLGEGIGMEKFKLDNYRGSQLSIWQDGKDYAVTYLKNQTFVPVNFKAAQNDTFTLTLEANTTEHKYIHLIDNLTGADIDLLETPDYTFEAKTSNYASRFVLVFDENSLLNPTLDDFDATDGIIQILDLTGRVVATNRNTKLTPGVYILRLITENDINSQKIIIK
jgi:hypothetical protein